MSINVITVPGGMTVEQTGGGCTALVAPVGDEHVLVVSDGNFGHTPGQSGGIAQVAVYTLAGWQNGGEPLVDWSAHGIDSPESVQPTCIVVELERSVRTLAEIDVTYTRNPLGRVCDGCGATPSEVCFPGCLGEAA